MLVQSPHISEATASYLAAVREDRMNEGRRRGKPCCWAAVQYHMTVMITWRHHLLAAAAADCQMLTQPRVAAD